MVRQRFRRSGMLVAVLAVLAVQGHAQNVIIRRGGFNARRTVPAVASQPKFVVNRGLTRAFLSAASKLNDKNYVDALKSLQAILDHPQDTYLPSKVTPSGFVSLKERTEELIAGTDQEGRKSYELQFGHGARQVLESAVESNDIEKLQELSRRYFLTKAGFEATYLLGCHYLDQAEPISAALCFERLLKHRDESQKWEPVLSLKAAVSWSRGGRSERAAEVLLQLKKATKSNELQLSGRKVPFFESKDDAVAWLAELLGPQQHLAKSPVEQWAIFRGTAARNAISSASVPVGDAVWSATTLGQIDDELSEDFQSVRPFTWKLLKSRLDSLTQIQRESNATILPAAHPLIIGNIIVFRTYQNLKAVDARTGQILWDTIVPDPAFRDLTEYLNNTVTESSVKVERLSAQQSLLGLATDRFLKQRAWHDVTTGTLSSDGQSVFAINEIGVDGSFGNLQSNPFRESFAVRSHNKLSAFEAKSGRFLWEIGGPSDGEIADHRGEYELGAAGSFFLGPPLPLKKSLFCLVETNGEIRLEARDPANGQMVWEQPLIMPDLSVLQNPLRRQSGISPAHADGFMVCPTTAGAVVAVNLDRRVLGWTYQYTSKVERQIETNPFAARIRGRRGRMYAVANFDDSSRWVDSVPTIVDGRVILTPRDSNELHCVNLDDGELVWKRPRGEAFYVATIHQGVVVVVGRSKVQAFRLQDGEPAWKHELPIPTPSGRGVRVNDVYHLPLSNGEVATIQLRTGSLLAKSRLHKNSNYGNLITADGVLIAQSANNIVAFRDYKELYAEFTNKLKQNPQDGDALALRGATRLHLGQTDAGLADLRKSLELKPSPIARSMLVDVLLEGLRIDFAGHRDSIAEIQQLIKDPRQQVQFLRLHADGLTDAGDHVNAFDAYLKLATLGVGNEVLERVDGSHFVRSDRRVQAVLEETYSQAHPDERKSLDEMLKGRLALAGREESLRSLHSLAQFPSSLPVANAARKVLIDRLVKSDNDLELELLSTRMTASDDPEIQRAASARLALLYLKNGKDQARPLLHRFSREWKDKPCLKNKTGGQLVEEWSKLDTVKTDQAIEWPKDSLQAEAVKRETPIERFYSFPFRGDGSSIPQGWQLQLDQQRQHVAAFDNYGRQLWRIKVADSPFMIPNSVGNYARSYGHLLVLVLGNRFIVLDALKSKTPPKVLWQRNLFNESAGPANSGTVRLQPLFLPGGRRRFGVADQLGRPIGLVSIVNEDFICYQAGSRLFAAEPLTGKILWVKHNVPFGSEVFGDRQFICVPNEANEELTVLRAADGATIGKRNPSDADMRLKTIGHRELGIKIVGNQQRVSLYDPVNQKEVWKREVTSQARITLVGDNELAVAEPAGEFRILQCDSGTPVLEAALDPSKVVSLTRIFVLRSADQYILLANTRFQGRSPISTNSINNQPIVYGHAFGFDRKTGKQVWVAELQSHGVKLDQPQELPVLVFTSRRFRQVTVNNRVTTTAEYMISILDKRNGEFVYQDSTNQSFNTYMYAVDPKTKQISVNFNDFGVDLAFFGETPSSRKTKDKAKKQESKPSK